MLVKLAFRFELGPNDKARAGLAGHAGAARYAYNWGLGVVKARMEAHRVLRALATRQGADAEQATAWAKALAGPVPWSLPALRREWNREKHVVAPWWAQYSKEAYNSGLDALARGLKAYFASRRGCRKGRPVGFPVPKRRSGRRSFRVTTGSFGVIDDRHVRLPRIGVLRTKEPTARLARLLVDGTARALSATVCEHAGRWYVSFGCQAQRAEPVAPFGPPVGVDVGVKHLAVLSTGEEVPAPKHLSRYQRRMARYQRQCARRRGPAQGHAPSRRWQRSQAKVARAHARVAQARSDGLHKLTTRLTKGHSAIVVEDLNVSGMTRTAKGSGHWRGKAGLNRGVLNSSLAELRRQVAYKATWYGPRLVVADRWYPSSKTCSGCGTVKTKLALSERTYRCEHCGLVMDRDANAAKNLACLVKLYSSTGTASGAGTDRVTGLRAGRGEVAGESRCSSANCEDGTAKAPKTATATGQPVAARNGR